jgi:acyl-CoA thioesterase
MRFGFAEVRMKVKPKHLNAAKACQGGVLFTLVDLAFALALNSYGTLALTV